MKNSLRNFASMMAPFISLLVVLLNPVAALAEIYTNDVYKNSGNTYQDSCKDAKAYAAKPKAARSTIMTAKCKADDGTWKKSTINLDLCPGVAMTNNNGQLTCQPFQETCSNVNIRYEYVPLRPDAAGTGTIGPSYNRYITASCLKDDGSEVNVDVEMSAIEGFNLGKKVLRNVDGVIQAECPSGKTFNPNVGGNRRCR